MTAPASVASPIRNNWKNYLGALPFLALVMVALGVGVVLRAQAFATPTSDPARQAMDGKPVVTNMVVLFDTQGNRVAVMFRFEVQNIDKIDENRALAEKLLPDAIRYAELQGVTRVAFQAFATTANLGVAKAFRAYGYVWNKENVTGNWVFYVKKAA
jgi:hypothetical protein